MSCAQSWAVEIIVSSKFISDQMCYTSCRKPSVIPVIDRSFLFKLPLKIVVAPKSKKIGFIMTVYCSIFLKFAIKIKMTVLPSPSHLSICFEMK